MEERFGRPKDIVLYIHDVKHNIKSDEIPSDMTLNQYLRHKMGLTGTKYMCREGGCGVCVVSVTKKHPITQELIHISVNSCLVPIYSCNNWKIATSEGIGNRKDGFHPIQQTLAKYNGTQCGFCSSGMIMNMYALYQSGNITMQEIENSFGGNICRCTGYRPILDAFKSMAIDSPENKKNFIDDIENFPNCKKENCEKSCPTPCFNSGPLLYIKDNARWYKVLQINEIFEILSTNPKLSYKLVAGNTAMGVYKDLAKADMYIDINDVKEFHQSQMNTTNFMLGASVNLTETMAIFKKFSQRDHDFAYLSQLADHIDLVAHVPVRNIGTVAGNLSIKYKHVEFPSDLFLLFETVGAFVVIVDSKNRETRLRPSDYLKFDMKNKVIKYISLPALDSSYKFQSYKIMPRSQNAHAMVNAGFLFRFDNRKKISSARIVYGGINPQFVHATNAETYLIGKDLFDNSVMQTLFGKLRDEIKPDYVLPDPTPEFRKQLAIALCYKCILSMAPNVNALNKSGGQVIERPLSSGSQKYVVGTDLKPLGQPLQKIEAMAQTSGEAKYILDMPDLPHQLYAAFVLARAPVHSKIKKVDTKDALKIPGVVAYFGKDNVPGKNLFISPETNLPEPEELFCSGDVKYFNQPIGIVVAESQELAEMGADAVNVTYNFSSQKPYLYTKDIVKNNVKAKIGHDSSYPPKKTGNNVKGTVSGFVNISWQYHYHMETQNCVVVPQENNEFDVYAGTQWMDLVQVAGAVCLGLPASKIFVYVRRMGGGFGAKISRNNLVCCAALVAAYNLRRPIKLWMPFPDNMDAVGKRNPMYAIFTNKVDDKGVVQSLKLDAYSDNGLHGNDTPIVLVYPLISETYNADSYDTDIWHTYSDNAAATWTRAPGSTEGLAVIEAIMEQTAYAMKIDPLDLRIRNLNPQFPKLLEFINDLKSWANIDARKKDIDKFNSENRWRKRGIAVVPMNYGIMLTGTFNVILSIYQGDGTIAISHAGIEMGQGINTKAIQTVAHYLGVPLDIITCLPSTTLTSPNSMCTGGSMTSELVCTALIKSCEVMNQRLKPIKDKYPNAKWAEIIKQAYNASVNLCVDEMFSAVDAENYHIFGVTACEVEIDILTGNHIIRRVDLLEDTGESMNPYIDIGQVEGAFIMGMGYYTAEEIILDPKTGKLMNNRTWNYKPPVAKDIPVEFNVMFPKNTNPASPLKAKAVAEPPFCMTVCVPLALRNAIKSARANSNPSADPWFPLDGPTTVECTFMNSLNDIKQYTL